ncbi:Elongation of very long chain fatty acids protein 7 [Araneus ventricosus]|uniref:Elongation of very long chain fatty acids protein n=1 Tax=Araneus ventricosus TaxID=182803 RepID=A0A4Y2MK40_ARAVE|nr:Elongation of very long chain fatty acids protein 7 [Araneus ventricosus]
MSCPSNRSVTGLVTGTGAATAGWIIYMLKYVEFADTIFFVLRKKNHLITNLHIIHHATLPILGWILFRSERSGFQFVPGVTNSIVHIVMYTYYGLAAIGPEVQKHLWWKEYLTRMQIVRSVYLKRENVSPNCQSKMQYNYLKYLGYLNYLETDGAD